MKIAELMNSAGPGVPHLDLQNELTARLRFYRELGIYDFYRRGEQSLAPEKSIEDEPLISAGEPQQMMPESSISQTADPSRALQLIREDIGDCTRCVLHKQGRKQIVFGTGNPDADIMFIGEAPGADEDEQGVPFVGRAGQLLNNMIAAMGIRREEVYIANIIKCRPPGNRTPERDECETCSPFLMRQIAVIKPKVIVALGAVAPRIFSPSMLPCPNSAAASTTSCQRADAAPIPGPAPNCSHLPSRILASRPPPKRRSLERSPNGDEILGPEAAKERRTALR
jgi:uracil-DNA glycosylase, family 4